MVLALIACEGGDDLWRGPQKRDQDGVAVTGDGACDQRPIVKDGIGGTEYVTAGRDKMQCHAAAKLQKLSRATQQPDGVGRRDLRQGVGQAGPQIGCHAARPLSKLAGQCDRLGRHFAAAVRRPESGRDRRRVLQKFGTVLGRPLRDLKRDREDLGQQLSVADLAGDVRHRPERLKGDRTRKHQLPRADLKNGRPRDLGHGLEPCDALGKKRGPDISIAHRQPPAHLAPQPQVLGRQQFCGTRHGLDKFAADPQTDPRECRAYLECGPLFIARQPAEAGGEAGQGLFVL